MNNLKEAEVKNKRVLVRCDFNVPIEEGKVVDDYRITQAMPTIRDLVKREAKVILVGHLGRPDKQKSFKKEGSYASLKEVVKKEEREDSLKPVYNELEKYFDNISFVNDCIGKRASRKVGNMEPGDVVLLENLRYYEDEQKCGDEFSRGLAELADIYVNNAFSASHRDHASISELPKHLPAFPGYLFERETRILSKIKDKSEKPMVVIIGGAKIKSKAKAIKYFMKEADYLLVGGKVANSILAIKGLAQNNLLPSKEVIDELEGINLTSQKLHLPVDVVASSDHENYFRHTPPGKVREEEEILDIGPETVELYGDIIREAKTIVWAGPLGWFENEKFQDGTKLVAQRIIENENSLKVIGGGDTGAALGEFGLRKYIDHASLGGGAMLRFLSEKNMPGLEALK